MFNNNIPFTLNFVPKVGVQQSSLPIQLSDLDLLQLNLLSKQSYQSALPNNLAPQIFSSLPQSNIPYNFVSSALPPFGSALLGLNYINSLIESNLKLKMLDQSLKGASLDKLMHHNLPLSVRNQTNTAHDILKNFQHETLKISPQITSSQIDPETAFTLCKARRIQNINETEGLSSEAFKISVPSNTEELPSEVRRKVPTPKENPAKSQATPKESPNQSILEEKSLSPKFSKNNQVDGLEVKREKRVYRKSSDRIKKKLVKQLAITRPSDDSRPLNQLQLQKINTDQRLTEEKKKYDEEVVQKYLKPAENCEIKVGGDHQAKIPKLTKTSRHRNLKQVWDPECYNETKEYLDLLEKLLEGSLIEQKALRMLKIKNFNVDSVVKMIKKKRIYFKSVYTAQVETEAK